MMDHIKTQSGEVDDDEVMDRLSVKWMKKPDTLTDLLEKLDKVMQYNGIEDIDEQFKELDDYATGKGVSKFVRKDTFKKWMDPATRGRKKIKTYSAWDVIKEYVKEHILGIQDDELEDEVATEDGRDESLTSVVPMLPHLGTAEGYYEIGEDSILRVMNDNPTADSVGELVTSVRKFRAEYHLIADHGRTVIPQRILRFVEMFIKETLESEEKSQSWICEDDKIVDQLVLRVNELNGSTDYKGAPKPDIINGRKIIGINIPDTEPAWLSRYSVTVASHPLDEVCHRVYSKIPKELFPDKGETEESLGRKILQTKFTDVIYNKFPNRSPNSLNEDTNSMQPLRRTSGMVKRMPYFFRSQLPEGEEEGHGKAVATLYGYPNAECPTNLWMCFPMTRLEYAQGLRIWTISWSSLTSVSRATPPNGVQLLIYHRLRRGKMGTHRDNNPGNVVLNLVNGRDSPWGDNPRVGGSRNSQVRGSSVMVFSRGRPMTLTLRYATPDRDVTQNRKYYVTSPSFQMRMEDGWITILDAVDDMLMVHEVDWDDDDGCETDVRFAW
eukprot:scaffold7105_cov71-Cyclotella_meneghiniana.AAC.2